MMSNKSMVNRVITLQNYPLNYSRTRIDLNGRFLIGALLGAGRLSLKPIAISTVQI